VSVSVSVVCECACGILICTLDVNLKAAEIGAAPKKAVLEAVHMEIANW
jgi:hypothetical protein